jgi:hypothetical protein
LAQKNLFWGLIKLGALNKGLTHLGFEPGVEISGKPGSSQRLPKSDVAKATSEFFLKLIIFLKEINKKFRLDSEESSPFYAASPAVFSLLPFHSLSFPLTDDLQRPQREALAPN